MIMLEIEIGSWAPQFLEKQMFAHVITSDQYQSQSPPDLCAVNYSSSSDISESLS